MAEQPLEMEDEGADLPEGLFPPESLEDESDDDGITPPELEAPSRGRGGPVLLRERYFADPGARLPEFDQPSAKAYAVEDRRDPSIKLFVLACTPSLPARMDVVKVLHSKVFPGILPMADWDVAHWPPLGQSTLMLIYERPLGGRVIDRLNRKDTRITEYDVPRKVAEPLLEGLRQMEEAVGPHRAVRVDNLYFLDEDMEEIVLGPNVTAPPGFDQPIIYESLERATCQPEGRGIGSIRDDIFALAVTIIQLVLGYNPVAKVKSDTLIHQRLENRPEDLPGEKAAGGQGRGAVSLPQARARHIPDPCVALFAARPGRRARHQRRRLRQLD